MKHLNVENVTIATTEKKAQNELNRVKNKIQKEAGITFHEYYYEEKKGSHIVVGIFSVDGENKYIVIQLYKDKEVFNALIDRVIENINNYKKMKEKQNSIK